MRVTPRDEAAPEVRRAGERRSFDEVLERAGRQDPQAPGVRPLALALPELREAARAVPPVIWAGRVAGQAAVELTFGGGLSVALRSAAGGIELSIRAAPELARAAQGDLPALVRALRERGVTVVRAEVRPHARGGGDGGRSASR